ncbi:MAG: RIO1 family regulatory kinase/ATPase [Candidatus Binatus sp.]
MTTALEIDEALLDAFIGDGSITDVLYVVRSGKEATVYCCRGASASGGGLIAAKVYRPLERRNFHNDAIYQTGRDAVLDTRTRRALANKSRHGRDVQYGTWINAEFQTIRMLYEAGADVPEVFSRSNGAILMEYFGDEDAAAPMLNRIALPRAEAEYFLRRIIDNVTLWLRNHLVHSDLSPYNLLYWEGRIVAIDFPQAVDARVNPSARSLLCRDLENVCGYFQKYGIRADPVRITNALWANYQTGRL